MKGSIIEKHANYVSAVIKADMRSFWFLGNIKWGTLLTSTFIYFYKKNLVFLLPESEVQILSIDGNRCKIKVSLY